MGVVSNNSSGDEDNDFEVFHNLTLRSENYDQIAKELAKDLNIPGPLPGKNLQWAQSTVTTVKKLKA